jgi:hypothetical protein
MKKIIIAAAAALCFAGGSFAQENAGGDSASSSAFGDMNKETIVAGVVAVGVLGAMVANNRGNAKDDDIVVIIEPTCSGSDPLVDGVCTGTTTTVTVSGTGTTTVPVTFTYFPTV